MTTAADSCPCFVYPMVKRLRETTDPLEAEVLKKRIIANVGDPEALEALLGPDGSDMRDFYPPKSTPSTLDTIDSFIEKFGGRAAQTDPPLFSESPAPPPFVLEEEDAADEADVEEADGSIPYQTLAQLVKSGQYAEALEIINLHNLKNPKKSVYFADQIRFLQKAMALSGSQTHNKYSNNQ